MTGKADNLNLRLFKWRDPLVGGAAASDDAGKSHESRGNDIPGRELWINAPDVNISSHNSTHRLMCVVQPPRTFGSLRGLVSCNIHERYINWVEVGWMYGNSLPIGLAEIEHVGSAKARNRGRAFFIIVVILWFTANDRGENPQ